jgi:uncharacterized protein with GYD domain
MTTFFMFGKYSQEAIKKISGQRSKDALAMIEKAGGKILSGYALMGEYDLVLLVQFPSNGQAFKTSVELAKLLGISFTTAPAVSIEEFDKLVG